MHDNVTLHTIVIKLIIPAKHIGCDLVFTSFVESEPLAARGKHHWRYKCTENGARFREGALRFITLAAVFRMLFLLHTSFRGKELRALSPLIPPHLMYSLCAR